MERYSSIMNTKTSNNSAPNRDELAVELAEYLHNKYDVHVDDAGYGKFTIGFINEWGEVLFGDELLVEIKSNM